MQKLLFRMFRFGIVGVLATAVHAGVSLTALNLLSVAPVVANGLGFLVAFSVSLVGHTFFTFRKQMSLASTLRFCLVAASAGLLSSATVFGLDQFTALAHELVLGIGAIVTPGFSFLCHSLWTFRQHPGKAGA
jgi:putative flippase GtrA